MKDRTSGAGRGLTIFLCLLAFTIMLSACSLLEKTDLTINWTTESELDIVGFNIYRSETADGDYTKINDALIPASSDPFLGGEYVFVDEGVSRGVTYYYKLETIDRNGRVELSSPIAVP